MNTEHLAIHRSLYEHAFWTERRIFSRFEAWLDLILRSSNDGTAMIYLRELCTTWGWSRKRIRRFMTYLDDKHLMSFDIKSGIVCLKSYDPVVEYLDTPDGASYIILDDYILKDPLWLEKRVFSRAEAWIDLLSKVTIRQTKTLYQSRLIHLSPGEILISQRRLGDRWQWSSGKVGRMLNMLQAYCWISLRKEQGITIMQLSNCSVCPERASESDQLAAHY